MSDSQEWTRPLLDRAESPSSYVSSDTLPLSNDYTDDEDGRTVHSRYVGYDVLPETAILGRHLGWGSAYVLIISRVIGSGIFATPGLIFQSVGSIGLSLSLWILGALAAWLGLAVSLEYGCMLPRSGG
jgi:hypothetical protein